MKLLNESLRSLSQILLERFGQPINDVPTVPNVSDKRSMNEDSSSNVNNEGGARASERQKGFMGTHDQSENAR